MAGAPALVTLGLLAELPLAADPAQALTTSYSWFPAFGVALGFRLDGLALTFGVLVTGIGALIVLYAGGYLAAYTGRERGRFYRYLLLFMAAMLGVVLSDNLITLFVFWELTSVASFLLIGFKHTDPGARRAARQALVVTGAGGLALLLGCLLIMSAAADLGLRGVDIGRISALSALPLDQHPVYVPALLLVLLGAFTKSAQVPFHFWLPGAMTAPTPVSAYLHSATMVKAGVFLLARLSPALAGDWLWTVSLGTVGAMTMLTGAYLATRQRDLKRVLAYSTVSVLGTLTMLIGVGTPLAVQAAVVLVVAHALYKATLFMVVGNLDHATGTRDFGRLGGLARALPITCAAALVAALSKAGAPPLVGFLAKELLYGAALGVAEVATVAALALALVAVVANAMLVATALMVGLAPFIGAARPLPETPHEAPPTMLLGPVMLAGAGLLLGLFAGHFGALFAAPAVAAIAGQPVPVQLALWHGVEPAALAVMALSAATLGLGGLLYVRIQRQRGASASADGATARSAEPSPGVAAALFERAVDGLPAVAGRVIARVSSGSLHRDLFAILVVFVLLLSAPLAAGWEQLAAHEWGPVRVDEVLLALVVMGGAVAACVTSSRLGAAAALGAVGVGVALLFAIYSAPDLAITLIMVEALTVLLLVLVLAHLPPFLRHSSRRWRVSDAAIAIAVGAFMSALTLASAVIHLEPEVAAYFAKESVPAGYGRNIVNVILVDFRAFDTLGEIVVVAIAGIGVYALLDLGRGGRGLGEDEASGEPPRVGAPAQTSLILQATAGPLAALLAVASLFVLLRGHNEPGGGFIAGLLIAGGCALYAIAHSPAAAREKLIFAPGTIVTVGLALVAVSASLGLFAGQPLLTAAWWGEVPLIGKVSSVLMFDVGVYLVVWGTALGMLLALAEAGWQRSRAAEDKQCS
ncbi:MAG: putative monovalent cation/H+ antiporter subunit A [Haliangiales bacterium]